MGKQGEEVAVAELSAAEYPCAMITRPFCSNRPSGFTLLETLIALSIFSLAMVALAEAIQQSAQASNVIRQDVQIHDRMTAMTTEAMRLIALQVAGQRPESPDPIEDAGVKYSVTAHEIKDLKNKDNVPVEGLWEVITVAEWMDGNEKQSMQDVAWVYPPLLPPLR